MDQQVYFADNCLKIYDFFRGSGVGYRNFTFFFCSFQAYFCPSHQAIRSAARGRRTHRALLRPRPSDLRPGLFWSHRLPLVDARVRPANFQRRLHCCARHTTGYLDVRSGRSLVRSGVCVCGGGPFLILECRVSRLPRRTQALLMCGIVSGLPVGFAGYTDRIGATHDI